MSRDVLPPCYLVVIDWIGLESVGVFVGAWSLGLGINGLVVLVLYLCCMQPELET